MLNLFYNYFKKKLNFFLNKHIPLLTYTYLCDVYLFFMCYCSIICVFYAYFFKMLNVRTLRSGVKPVIEYKKRP